MAKKQPRASKITSEKFGPYALAIGQMALTWNELHEALGHLFGEALDLKSGHDARIQCAAVWGSVTNDRQKRLMLDAAINWVMPERHKRFPRLAADILWITQRANSLEDRRNNVIHAPLDEATGIVAAMAGLTHGSVFPGGLFNERSGKLMKATVLSGKDLLREMIVYRDCAQMLADFSDDIFAAWRGKASTWPERPDLPSLKDKASKPPTPKAPKLR
jgi:hypothetical protein